MRNELDERYASDPVWHQTREALISALQTAGRLISADLGMKVPPNNVADALNANMDALGRAVDAHRAMAALESEVVPNDGRPQ